MRNKGLELFNKNVFLLLCISNRQYKDNLNCSYWIIITCMSPYSHTNPIKLLFPLFLATVLIVILTILLLQCTITETLLAKLNKDSHSEMILTDSIYYLIVSC